MANKLEKINGATAVNGSPDYSFNCPGCGCSHGIWLTGPHKWDWNGSMDKPTISPSIKVEWTDCKFTEAGDPIPETRKEIICHSFVKDGNIQFLGDCTHHLAGKTMELPDVENTPE